MTTKSILTWTVIIINILLFPILILITFTPILTLIPLTPLETLFLAVIYGTWVVASIPFTCVYYCHRDDYFVHLVAIILMSFLCYLSSLLFLIMGRKGKGTMSGLVINIITLLIWVIQLSVELFQVLLLSKSDSRGVTWNPSQSTLAKVLWKILIVTNVLLLVEFIIINILVFDPDDWISGRDLGTIFYVELIFLIWGLVMIPVSFCYRYRPNDRYVHCIIAVILLIMFGFGCWIVANDGTALTVFTIACVDISILGVQVVTEVIMICVLCRKSDSETTEHD